MEQTEIQEYMEQTEIQKKIEEIVTNGIGYIETSKYKNRKRGEISQVKNETFCLLEELARLETLNPKRKENLMVDGYSIIDCDKKRKSKLDKRTNINPNFINFLLDSSYKK